MRYFTEPPPQGEKLADLREWIARELTRVQDALNFPDQESWTPTITFATPGDLAVTYSTRVGYAIRFGRMVFISFNAQTSAFTHTTASGDLRVAGLPAFVVDLSAAPSMGGLIFSGITKASYTNFVLNADQNTQYLTVDAGGSGVGFSTVKAADMPTGGTVVLAGSVLYMAKA